MDVLVILSKINVPNVVQDINLSMEDVTMMIPTVWRQMKMDFVLVVHQVIYQLEVDAYIMMRIVSAMIQIQLLVHVLSHYLHSTKDLVFSNNLAILILLYKLHLLIRVQFLLIL
jgi:hypothetical protein